MRDYSKQITALYSLFDRSPVIRDYLGRGYSIERKQPFYGGYYNKYTFALKNGQEITFTRREIDADASLIFKIASVIRKFDLLLDFCSSKIVTDSFSYFMLDDNYSGGFDYPEEVDYHFWFHPTSEGDNYENKLFVGHIEEDACLRAICDDSRLVSFPHSLLKKSTSGKMKMFLYNEPSKVFLVFSLKHFPVEQITDFFDILTAISKTDLGVVNGPWYDIKLYGRKAKFAERPIINHTVPPEPEYHPVDTDLLPGDNVQHASFGRGIIKDIIKAKGYAVVDFLNAGEKTIALHSGKLQKIENDEK